MYVKWKANRKSPVPQMTMENYQNFSAWALMVFSQKRFQNYPFKILSKPKNTLFYLTYRLPKFKVSTKVDEFLYENNCCWEMSKVWIRGMIILQPKQA